MTAGERDRLDLDIEAERAFEVDRLRWRRGRRLHLNLLRLWFLDSLLLPSTLLACLRKIDAASGDFLQHGGAG